MVNTELFQDERGTIDRTPEGPITGDAQTLVESFRQNRPARIAAALVVGAVVAATIHGLDSNPDRSHDTAAINGAEKPGGKAEKSTSKNSPEANADPAINTIEFVPPTAGLTVDSLGIHQVRVGAYMQLGYAADKTKPYVKPGGIYPNPKLPTKYAEGSSLLIDANVALKADVTAAGALTAKLGEDGINTVSLDLSKVVLEEAEITGSTANTKSYKRTAPYFPIKTYTDYYKTNIKRLGSNPSATKVANHTIAKLLPTPTQADYLNKFVWADYAKGEYTAAFTKQVEPMVGAIVMEAIERHRAAELTRAITKAVCKQVRVEARQQKIPTPRKNIQCEATGERPSGLTYYLGSKGINLVSSDTIFQQQGSQVSFRGFFGNEIVTPLGSSQ
jgi:hypothetical protein